MIAERHIVGQRHKYTDDIRKHVTGAANNLIRNTTGYCIYTLPNAQAH